MHSLQLVQFRADGVPQHVMLRTERELLVAPPLARIQPHRPAHEIGWLPLKSRPHMRMEEAVGVAENLQIHPPESRVQAPARTLDRFPQLVHVGQERQPPCPRQVRQSLHIRVIRQEHRVSRQELDIPNHRETRLKTPEYGGVLSPQRTSDPVHPPVITHGGERYAPPINPLVGTSLGTLWQCWASGWSGSTAVRVTVAAVGSRSTSAMAATSRATLDELLCRSDVVSVQASELPETRHMVDAASLTRMRDGATLINTSRGFLVDTEALTAELVFPCPAPTCPCPSSSCASRSDLVTFVTTAGQLASQEAGFGLFFHFGLNTFNGRERPLADALARFRQHLAPGGTAVRAAPVAPHTESAQR